MSEKVEEESSNMPAYADAVPTKPPHPRVISSLAQPDKDHAKAGGARGVEAVVVSGMSGRFPESNNVEQFATNLFDGVDMVTQDDRRWTPGLHGLPTRSGKLLDLSHFDSSFFGVSPRQAHAMDPQLRLLLELTYEAVVDAGYNPSELRGRRIGVYIGVSSSESEEAWTSDPASVSGYALTGCCRAMFPNRISYTFDFKGPSFAIDTACSSSMVALQQAWRAVSEGEIEAAVVGGTNLTLKPQNSMQFNALNMLSADGKCKAFDASGNGYVRSEAAVVIVLQRGCEARRVYADLVHARANTDGHKNEGVTFPSGAVQQQLLQEVYTNAGVSPQQVSYVEAHGTGTKAGDPQEVGALAEVFCPGRTTPLLMGSVKSNMGHSEPASGLCGIVKVLLAMQRKELPGNLHFNTPNPEIAALNDGRIKVVSENTPWSGGYAAINSFGFGGANVHILLKSPGTPPHSPVPTHVLIPSTQRINPAVSTSGVLSSGEFAFNGENQVSSACPAALNTEPLNNLPRLVVGAGRTDEGITTLLEGVRDKGTPALYSLMDKLSDMPTNTHPFRGYTVISSDKTVLQVSDVPPSSRPLWLVFSGMGSQWVGCGAALMQLPVFAAAIRRCHAALLPVGLNLTEILTSQDPAKMASTPASFSTIAAMQVGLIELLKSVGMKEVSGLVGHSVGELGCAYADDALTAEQTVLSAYWRGHAVQSATLPPGAMAAVGLNAAEAEKWCKDGVVVACHNGHDSVTISGPKAAIEEVSEELTNEGIFCRAVKSEGVAFHHPSLKAAAPQLFEELSKVIKVSRRRSSRWVSSSVPESEWDSPDATSASPTYLVKNLLSPVLFVEAISKIPEGAVVVEVSPHGLLQAVLRRSLPQCTPIPLIRKEATSTMVHFMEALGKMYMAGVTVDVSTLYPTVPLPVPSSTPSIASLLRWDHNQEWDVAKFNGSGSGGPEYQVKVALDTDDYSYLEGHKLDGRILFPATGYMILAWQAVCRLQGTAWQDTPVTFSDINLHQATVLSSTPGSTTTFTVRVLLAKGEFEVVVSDSVAASGRIHVGVDESGENLVKQVPRSPASSDPKSRLLQKDVYRELRLRGYQYGGIFQGIRSTDMNGTEGTLKWQDNWVPLLDTMLQFSLVGAKQHALMLPTRIRKVTVNPEDFLAAIKQEDDINTVEVHHNPRIGVTRCQGVVIEGLKATLAPRRPTQDQPLLETYQLVPLNLTPDHPLTPQLTNETGLGMLLDLVLENLLTHRMKVVERTESSELVGVSSLPLDILRVLASRPQLKVEYIMSSFIKLPAEEQGLLTGAGVSVKVDLASILASPPHLLILHQAQKSEVLEKLAERSFVLTDSSEAMMSLKNNGFVNIAAIHTLGMTLLRKIHSTPAPHTVLEVSTNDKEFSWVTPLREMMLSESKDTLWLLSSQQPSSGIIGLVNCLRRESGGEKIRCVFAPEGKAKVTNELLERDLAINVKDNGAWGTYRHLPLPLLATQHSANALLNVATRGDLASLSWFQMAPLDSNEGDNMVVCDVHYAPLNFRDVMLATGKLPPDALPGDLATKECILGLEFAGSLRGSGGQRVMGLVAAGGLATSVKADPLLTWPVPSSWSLQDAATVPVVYATAYYALVVRGGLRQGERVLIHAGSGGVGQAAISIALAASCTVYTTVSTQQKKAVLQQRFPQLKDENFSNSRNMSFEYDILERTEGKGVDLVLNSLAGELLQASVRCLREHGRFLEIGKADLANNTALGMAIFLKNVTFHGILLDSLFDASEEERRRLNVLLAEGLSTGVVTPLPATLFTRDQAEEAFRYMATGKHIGKVVLEVQPSSSTQDNNTLISKTSQETTSQKEEVLVPAIPRITARPNLVYIITGGLGGLGLELAGWLVKRGAKKLVLTSRRGITSGYQALCVRRLEASGVEVRILTQDASTLVDATKLLNMAAQSAPIGGIFHLAVVLEDALLENQSPEKFQRVNRAKGDGAVALDAASRRTCPQLHLFVAFSSVACGRGNPGQSNYGWANSVCERVAAGRVRDGLPGVAIQWGGVGDVGVLADTLGEIEVGGTKPQSVRSVLECLDVLLLSSAPVVSSLVLASSTRKTDGAGGAVSLLKAVANILGMKDTSKAPLDVCLGDLGLDSLMSVEVKQTLERQADLVLSPSQVRQLTLRDLQRMDNNEEAPTSPQQDSTSEQQGERDGDNDIARGWLTLPLVSDCCVTVLHQADSSTSQKTPLFLASPIQGTAQPLTIVAKELGGTVYGLEYPPDLPHLSITHLAQYLVQEVKKLCPTGDFTLGGYSFGATVALEMVRILETENRAPSSVILLDGSQSYVSEIIDGYKSRLNASVPSSNTGPGAQLEDQDAQEQVEILVVFIMQFCSVEATSLKKTLLGLKSWKERVNHVAQLVTDNRKASGVSSSQNEHQQAVTAFELLYKRLIAGGVHKWEGEIRPPTLLVRARDNPQASALGTDYGLSKIVQGRLRVEEVAGTHESFVLGSSGQQVASLIQDFLKNVTPSTDKY
ncbi:hypothetical protein Pcinc_019416 [Petrolisthes cinctipes]|uniref:Fatty acid synthase n=1 Tax=Petrolisthes cinctipes TaxID=88211 RepID=A0AAE1FK49_PETCI|nr:hypothetical protein Pcinc_019416 [Petrolisthes cinctipes]